MKNITNLFVLVFMVSALAVPLFPFAAAEDCCCGDACFCETSSSMSCEMEITASKHLPILPIPAAPLNHVNLEQPRSAILLADQDMNESQYDNIHFSDNLINTSDPPPSYTSPLLI